MLILGHNLLEKTSFYFIKETPKDKLNNYCLYYDEKIISCLKAQKKDFSIIIQNKDEIFLANAIGAKFLIFEDENLAKFASEVAEFYLFDSKILFLVDTLSEFEIFYKLRVDGVILKDIIKNFN